MSKKLSPDAKTLRKIAAAFRKLEETDKHLAADPERDKDHWWNDRAPVAAEAYRLAIADLGLLTSCRNSFGTIGDAGDYHLNQVVRLARKKDEGDFGKECLRRWVSVGQTPPGTTDSTPFSEELRRWAAETEKLAKKEPRQRVPKEVETKVLTRSKRRCCICYGLYQDLDVKKGQIAHLDGNRDNNTPRNLAWLCLKHHDEHDSKTSQSKGFTIEEVRKYRTDLYHALKRMPEKSANDGA